MDSDADDMALATLISLGVAEVDQCREAVAATSGQGPDAAAAWLFASPEEREELQQVAEELEGGGELLMERHKLVIVVRQDLGMSPGKVAAQACHAALRAHREAPEPQLHAWLGCGEPIVVLRCADGAELGALQREAEAQGLQCSSIQDAGRTEVDPGTTTVLSIGPGMVSAIDHVTGNLSLLE